MALPGRSDALGELAEEGDHEPGSERIIRCRDSSEKDTHTLRSPESIVSCVFVCEI